MHPSVGKLYNLLKRANPEKATPKVQKLLEEISQHCASCTTFSVPPFRFRATIPPEDIIFNREVAIDLMWLNGKPVLHVVDTATNFQNAVFLKSKSTDDIWNDFIDCWTSVHVGFPEIIRLDRESSFTSDQFRKNAKTVGVDLQFSGIESHNAIGQGERYHRPLRRVFNILKEEHKSLDDKHILRISTKAINDTMGPNGLVPSLLVFGVLPAFPCPNTKMPNQVERFAALRTAKAEMEKIVAETRIKRALKSKLPPATKFLIKPGDEVRVYREISKKWEGPFTVTKTSPKLISVTDGIKVKQFNITTVLPIAAETNDADHKHDMETLQGKEPSTNLVTTTAYDNIYLTEVLLKSDPRYTSSKSQEAIKPEIEGLLERKAFAFVDIKDIPVGANILGGRIILAIKNPGTLTERHKARFVVQGHKDREKGFLVHISKTVRYRNLRLMISITVTLKFKL